MRYPINHPSRYAAFHRSALRKGYRLEYNNDGTWSLTDLKTGEPSEAVTSLSLDDVGVFLMTQRLVG